MEVCTIIAKNYLAHARVLAGSLAAHNPQARMWTLIIDEHTRYVDPAQEPFEVLTPADIGCEAFTHMAMRYSVLELSTAVKPWLLRHLLERTGGPVTYLDPDIKIFGSLAALDGAAAEHGVALTPHNDEPLPDDGKRPSQVDVMIAGVYNLGYISIARREEVDRLLDWWSDRLERDCRVDPVWGYFVDQRWFDLAPGFLSDVAIIRDPEYNVAYWNLHSRRLTLSGERYLVDDRPLAFFHFSGFDPREPDVLSRHQNRISVSEHPVLPRLLAEYSRDLADAGHRISREWPYSFNALADGTPIDDTIRSLYDEYADEHGGNVASPFTLEGALRFAQWWSTPAPAMPAGVNRAIAAVYRERADVRATFSDLSGSDGLRLVEWARGPGSLEMPLLARTMTAAPAANGNGAQAPARPPRPPLTEAPKVPWGVNVVGDFHSGLEPGELARQLLGLLDTESVPAVPVQSQTTRPGREWFEFATVPADQAPFAVNLLVLEPDALPDLAGHAGASLFSGRYTVALAGYAASAAAPSALTALSLVDEVWAASDHVVDLLEPASSVPIRRIRLPVLPRPLRTYTRAELGLDPEGFLFLVTVDYRESFAAQNPLGAISAFISEFGASSESRARLVVAHRGAEHDRAAHGQLLALAAEHPHIRVISCDDAFLRASALIATCDCQVSLHREVAFGWPLAEAMARGKPAIATGYSGNLEFMSADNSLLVDCAVVPVAGRENEQVSWAEPDLAQAGALMRRVQEDTALAERLGAAAAQAIRERHSRAAALPYIAPRLEEIRVSGLARPGAGAAAPLPALGKARMRLREGPVPRPNAAGGTARESLRKGVLRGMQPYTAYQDRVNRELLEAVEAVYDAVAEQRLAAGAERAYLMAHDRRRDDLEEILRFYEQELEGVHLREMNAGIEHIKRLLTLETDRGVYLALGELSRRHREVGPDPGLPPADVAVAPFELRVFSQNGEDGVLSEILRRVGAPGRSFVEFGIESGREGNCVFLADAAGWAGLFMEGDPDFFDQLERKYASQPTITTLQAMVTPENVDELFDTAAVPSEPDVMSIDVDGQDYWIWEAIESRRPRVLVVEYNSSLDPKRRLVQPRDLSGWDGTAYYGASLGALESLGERKGYRLVHTERSGANAFFVRDDLLADRFPEPAAVVRRGFPNYFGRGYQHPVALPGKRYLDLDTDELVTVES